MYIALMLEVVRVVELCLNRINDILAQTGHGVL